MSLHIVILAAGMGKRMFSQTPKVLHPLAGKPMLRRVVETAQALNPAAIHIIYGHAGDAIRKALADLSVNWIVQKEQSGTGHAVLQALEHVPHDATLLVLSGDVPLIHEKTLSRLVDLACKRHSLTLLLASLANPAGLGRIVRNNQQAIQAIVEEKDASAAEKQIKEIYSGICSAPVADLARWLPKLTNNNAQGEYYLTDIIAMAVAEGKIVASIAADDISEIQGVNNRLQLHELERIWQKQQAQTYLLQGVAIADASRFDLRGELRCGEDVFIDINCVFSGKVILGNRCTIGPNCTLENVVLGDDCEIAANSVLSGCTIGKHAQIGPFARIRPGTQMADYCKIGNFVETKKAIFGEGSKASHLSYLGDVSIGREVNIGAGTITCNYDGVNKHQTTIEDGVFIGSGTELVAPVTIAANATIGAGSTVRKNAPGGELTLTESRQKTILGWKRPVKQAEISE